MSSEFSSDVLAALSAIERELGFRWMLCDLQSVDACTAHFAREIDYEVSRINRSVLASLGYYLARKGEAAYDRYGHFRLIYDLVSVDSHQAVAHIYIYSTARVEYHPDVAAFRLIIRAMVVAAPMPPSHRAQTKHITTLSEFMP